MSRTEITCLNFLFFFFFISCLWPLPPSYAVDTISSAQNFSDGQMIISLNQIFEFGFFSPGESTGRYVGVWYHGGVADNPVVWVANKDKPLQQSSSGVVGIANDGNLAIWSANGTLVWSTTAFSSSRSSIAVLQDDGNLVLRAGNSSSSGRVLWQSFDSPSNIILPGMKIGIRLRTGKKWALRSWTSDRDPAPGIFEFGIDPQDPNQFFIWRGSVPYWRVLFWNESRYNVILSDGSNEEELNYTVVRSQDEVYFQFSFSPATYAIRQWLLLTTEGILEIKTATRNGGLTTGSWSGRDSNRRCSSHDACGPNTICNENAEPMCKCLPGFTPMSDSFLYTADFRGGGCRMSNPLQCGAEDGFLDLKSVQLADGAVFSGGSVYVNETGCREMCISDGCGCRAYSFTVDRIHGYPLCQIRSTELTDLQEKDADDGSAALNLHVRVAASELNLARRQCENCGTNIIPYPLSTGPNCGSSAYRNLYCNASTGRLYFQPQDGSSYEITSIHNQTRRFKIKLQGIDLCWAGSTKRSDIKLNSSLPFHATTNNTVLLLNCSSTAEKSLPLNCRSSSPCQRYIRQGRSPCFNPEACCGYVTQNSRSSMSHHIGVSNSGCLAYTSIINLDLSTEVKYWQEGVEIQWDAPLEPVCASSEDCDDLPNSSCKLDNRENDTKRCICNENFQWDDSIMTCRPSGKNKRVIAIVAAIIAIGALLAMALICGLWRKRRREVNRRKFLNMSLHRLGERFQHGELLEIADRRNNLDVPFIDFQRIVQATENFADSNKLGRGGFGAVYKGTFPGGLEVAVKRLSKNSRQGLEEFKNEVLLIAKLQHRNLVRMLAYCVEGDEKMLIYEYMPNNSLDFFLFDSERCKLLTWERRFNIILGIARGLVYLHQDSRLRIIHRDLKPGNVLLDEDMNPKISDFGMAMIFGGNQTHENASRAGTYGYMSPESVKDGLFSVKSDVFSFGVIVLEMVSGKRISGFNNDDNSFTLTGYAWQLWNEEKGLDLMDPSLHSSTNPTQVLKCIHFGLLCVQENEADRPTMASALVALESETPNLSTPKHPGFFHRRHSAAILSSLASTPLLKISNNEVTISTLEGR